MVLLLLHSDCCCSSPNGTWVGQIEVASITGRHSSQIVSLSPCLDFLGHIDCCWILDFLLQEPAAVTDDVTGEDTHDRLPKDILGGLHVTEVGDGVQQVLADP